MDNTYGLTIIRSVEDKTGKNGRPFKRVLCRCQCGNEKIMRRHDIENRLVHSCGCIRKRQLSEHPIGRKEPGYSYLTQVLNSYRANAKKRGVVFALTREQFMEIASKDCHYCGSPPKKGRNFSTKKLKRFFNDTAVHNGIDRVDNTVGYAKENLVPCCKQCNWAKGNLSQLDFLDWIARVHTYQNT